MKGRRSTQPYRGGKKGKGPAGSTLGAMLRGRQPGAKNPADTKRELQKLAKRRKRRKGVR